MDVPPTDPAMRGPLPAYRAKVAAGELAADSAQQLAAERLQGCGAGCAATIRRLGRAMAAAS